MPIVNRLKKLFVLGSGSDSQKSGSGPGAKSIPDIVRLETDVREYWTLDEVIGDGAFGSVFKARSKSDPGRVAAAKAMELEDDESQDVMVEVSILTLCKHPNIVELYDAFTMGNRITLLLEYCGGGAVDSIMMELSRPLSEAQIHYIMKEILKALDFLHGKNVIHRDLKAGNVLLTSDARVKLADFGVSALCKDAREVRSTFIGTPYWMAPEVMICETFPEKHYNKLADIWSFGITLIEMAEEKPPYAEMNPAKVVFKVIKADPPTLERPNQWSANFRAVVAKCLTKDPENRPTAADVLAHPFFAAHGSVHCVRTLISEVNAEQVTTEVVMGSDDEALYDDDDDDDTATVSSAATANETRPDDAESVSSKQQRQRQSVISITDQKVSPQEAATSAKTAISNAGTTMVVELAPSAEIDAASTETSHKAGISSNLLSGKKQRAPSLPESAAGDLEEERSTIAVVEINGGEDAASSKPSSVGRPASAESGKHHRAVEDALSDLDKALNLEETQGGVPEEPSPIPALSPSPGFLPSERSDPTVPLQQVPAVPHPISNRTEKMSSSRPSSRLSSAEVNSTTDSEKSLQKEDQTSDEEPRNPKRTHQIRDVIAEQRSHLQGRPTTVHITDTGAVVTTSSALLDKKLAEINAKANLVRPNASQGASYVYALKAADNQQLKVKVIAKKDDGSAPTQKVGTSEQLSDYGHQQSHLSKIKQKKKDVAAYKSFDSLLKVDGEEFMSPGATQRSSSQPHVNSSSKGATAGTCSRHVIQVGESTGASTTLSTDKRPLAASLSTDQIHAYGPKRSVQGHIAHSASQDGAGKLVKNYDQSEQNYYYYYGKSASEKSSPLMETRMLQQQQQSMRAEFKVLPPPGTKTKTEVVQPDTSAVRATDRVAKKTVVEVRRPLSYPETKGGGVTKKAVSPAVSSSRGTSEPVSQQSFSRHSAVVAAQAAEHNRRPDRNRNRVGEQDQNRKRSIPEQESEQSRIVRNRNVLDQKGKKGSQNGTVPLHHQVAPTTSDSGRREPQLEQEYNYFGTASSGSSSSSRHLQPQSYESSYSSDHDNSSFLATAGSSNSGSATVNPTVVRPAIALIPRAALTVPPPEPPVDYYENSISSNGDDRKSSVSQQTAPTAKKPMPTGNGTKASNSGTSMVGSRRSPHRQTVTKKTRVYVVDGVQMTSTSHQVFGVKQDYELRKQQLHELRRLQREEARQQRELNAKAESLRNEQAKRFSIDKENIYKKTDIELQALARTQKRQLKECEELHNEDMKQALKRIQSDQERELRVFREQLKQEQRDLKVDMDALPRTQRKDSYRLRKEQLDKEQQEKEMNFIAKQQAEQAAHMAHVQLDHKMKILLIEKNFQQQKHAVLRSREASEWDLEENQLAERHLLNKQELKDRFYLQRTQMFARHQRELDHMRRVNEMDEEEQVRLYASFKKRLPKDFRTESKTRIAMFKESLRISCQNDDPATLNEKIRAFEEKEKQRVRNALEEHDSKYSRRLRELKEKNATAMRELEEIHSEKRKMLLEAEQNKIEMYEKEYEQVVADWRAGLPIRKQALEAEFARELDEVEAFYRKENAQMQQLSAAGTPTGSISSKQDIVLGSTAAAVMGNSTTSLGGQY